jgi:hypothetical protein
VTVKYDGRCVGCGWHIVAGEHAFYYPLNRSLYGYECGCGDACERDFTAHEADERVNEGLMEAA